MSHTDTAPAERWQHGHDIVVLEGRQQIATPVAALRRSNRIGDAEVVAAARYYADYAFGVCGANDSERGGSGGGVDGYNISQIDALGRYEDVRRAMGRFTLQLLHVVVIEEKSIRQIAGGGGRAATTISGLAADALKALADHYSKADGSRPGSGSKIRTLTVARGAANSS